MSQATALLNSLPGDMPATYSDNSGELIIVDDNRFITVPESLKRLGVQYDHNIETVTIQCPRYWDDHDMSKMSIYINCMLPDSTKVQYNAKNISPSGRRMTFDWTIDNNLTQKSGTISFLICICKTDSEGNEERHWNSELNQECYISGGLECSETILNQYPAIITDLLTRMEEVEALATPASMEAYVSAWLAENHSTAIAELEAKGAEVLASIPTDYAETHALAKDAARTKADAIICAAQDEVISITDSADDYLRNLRILGRTDQAKTTGTQMFDESKLKVGYYDNSEGGWVNTSSTTYRTIEIDIPVAGIYTISFSTQVAFIRENGNTLNNVIGLFRTVTLEAGIYRLSFRKHPSTAWGEDVKIMFNAGSDILPYEPYSGGQATPNPDWPQNLSTVGAAGAVEVSLYGSKNLLNITKGGTAVNVTETVKDGLVSFQGTASGSGGRTAWGRSEPVTLYPGIYTLSMEVPSGTAADPCLTIYGTSTILASKGTFTVKETTKAYLGFNYIANTVYNAQNVKVQLECGSAATEYEPFKPIQTIAVAAVNGLPGIPVTENGNYTDADGQQWICDEIDFNRGIYIQRVASKLFDGADGETITLYAERTNVYGFAFKITDVDMLKPSHAALCSHFKNIITGISSVNEECFLCGAGSTTIYVMVNKSRLTEYSVSAFKNWLSDNQITILFQLAAPIETPLTVDEIAAYEALRTSYPNTVVMNDAGAEMELKYHADTEMFITNLIDSVSVKSAMITLPANKWVEVESGYAQAIALNGVTPNSKIDLHPTPAQLASLIEEEISLMACNDNGAVTIYSVGTSPTFDIVMQVQITEVVPV